MAITAAGDIKGILAASAVVAAGISGVVKVYEKAGELAATDVSLPAIVQTVVAPDLPQGRIEHLVGQEVVNHTWYLDLLIDRAGDLYAEQDAAMPFVPLVLAAYRNNIHLGEPAFVSRCLPQSYRFIVVTHGSNSFFAVRFLMQCKAKAKVEYTDPA